MANGTYRIATALKHKVNYGVSDLYDLNLHAYGKLNTAVYPYCVANEYICAELGRFLGLPIPPAGLTSTKDGGIIYFASLDFNFTGDTLPPIDTERCCKQLPKESTGLIVFDALITNSDRHPRNVAVDFLAKPPRMSVFDHSHALLGSDNGKALERLNKLQNRLGITGGEYSAGNRHCLINWLETQEFFPYWLSRVSKIPDFLIDDVCFKAQETVVDLDVSSIVKKFLVFRRDNLASILNENFSEFKKIDDWEDL